MELREYYTVDVRTNYTAGGSEFSRKVGVIDTSMLEDSAAGFPKKPKLLEVFKKFSSLDWTGRMNLQVEEWRNCPGLNCKYQVSSLGRVRKRLDSEYSRTFYVPTAEKYEGWSSWKQQGWREIRATDYEYKLIACNIKRNTNGGGGSLYHSIQWGRESTAASFGVRNGCMYGGRSHDHWLRFTAPANGYNQERTDFLVALTYSSLGNPNWDVWLQENEEREKSLRGELQIGEENSKTIPHYVLVHLNTELWDCRASNIAWVLREQKSKYHPRGLSGETLERIYHYLHFKHVGRENIPLKWIAEEVGCSPSTISRLSAEYEETFRKDIENNRKSAALKAKEKESAEKKIVLCKVGEEDLKLRNNLWTNKDVLCRLIFTMSESGLSYDKIKAQLQAEHAIVISKGRISDFYYWGRALIGSERRQNLEDSAA